MTHFVRFCGHHVSQYNSTSIPWSSSGTMSPQRKHTLSIVWTLTSHVVGAQFVCMAKHPLSIPSENVDFTICQSPNWNRERRSMSELSAFIASPVSLPSTLLCFFLLQYRFVLVEVTAFLALEPHGFMRPELESFDFFVVVRAVPDLIESCCSGYHHSLVTSSSSH